MNKLTIIGNLTKDPELRTTTTGVSVCTFNVAVNRKKTKQNQNPDPDFFRVTAWRELGEICSKYLAKGRKVCVIGPVSLNVFTRNDGSAGGSLEITADDVEFLTAKGDNGNGGDQATGGQAAEQQPPVDAESGFQQVETDELPF